MTLQAAAQIGYRLQQFSQGYRVFGGGIGASCGALTGAVRGAFSGLIRGFNEGQDLAIEYSTAFKNRCLMPLGAVIGLLGATYANSNSSLSDAMQIHPYLFGFLGTLVGMAYFSSCVDQVSRPAIKFVGPGLAALREGCRGIYQGFNEGGARGYARGSTLYTVPLVAAAALTMHCSLISVPFVAGVAFRVTTTTLGYFSKTALLTGSVMGVGYLVGRFLPANP